MYIYTQVIRECMKIVVQVQTSIATLWCVRYTMKSGNNIDDEVVSSIVAPARRFPLHQSDNLFCNMSNSFVSARMVGTISNQSEKVFLREQALQPRVRTVQAGVRLKEAEARAKEAEARTALLTAQVKAANNKTAQAEARATEAERRLASQIKASKCQEELWRKQRTEMIQQVFYHVVSTVFCHSEYDCVVIMQLTDSQESLKALHQYAFDKLNEKVFDSKDLIRAFCFMVKYCLIS